MKKRILVLSAIIIFLFTSCAESDNVQIVTVNRPQSPLESSLPSSDTVNEAIRPASPEDGTVTGESIETEPNAPEVPELTFTEEQLRSGTLYLSGADQFVVSKNKNIVTIILDAADNRYVKALLNNNPDAFKGFEDFTLYDNTCSVFDSTFQSVTQIYSGVESRPIGKVSDWNDEAWSCERAIEFYRRFHKAGYKMNIFADANLDPRQLIGKLDNLAVSDNPPDGRDFYHLNHTFREQIKTMSLADNDYNYFTVQHIWGAHTPTDKDSFEEQMVYLFDIVREYIDSLREFGVYDNATIIVMADHGTHDVYNYPDSTPMFMIKEPNRHSDKLTVSSAPIYFADLMSTYLVNAGLYDEDTDRELFGSSIYDFDENSVRERIANYRMVNKKYATSGVSSLVPSYGYNVIYSYTYTGNTEDLLAEIRKRKPEIFWMEEDAA